MRATSRLPELGAAGGKRLSRARRRTRTSPASCCPAPRGSASTSPRTSGSRCPADKNIHASFNTAFISRYKSDNSLSEYSWIPAHSVTDLAVGFGKQRFEVNLIVKNLFDDRTPPDQHLEQLYAGRPALDWRAVQREAVDRGGRLCDRIVVVVRGDHGAGRRRRVAHRASMSSTRWMRTIDEKNQSVQQNIARKDAERRRGRCQGAAGHVQARRRLLDPPRRRRRCRRSRQGGAGAGRRRRDGGRGQGLRRRIESRHQGGRDVHHLSPALSTSSVEADAVRTLGMSRLVEVGEHLPEGFCGMVSMARWRSGNAAVCKTAIRGFDSLPRLQSPMSDPSW